MENGALQLTQEHFFPQKPLHLELLNMHDFLHCLLCMLHILCLSSASPPSSGLIVCIICRFFCSNALVCPKCFLVIPFFDFFHYFALVFLSCSLLLFSFETFHIFNWYPLNYLISISLPFHLFTYFSTVQCTYLPSIPRIFFHKMFTKLPLCKLL